MKRILLALLVTGLLQASVWSDTAQEDQKRIEGTWLPVAAELAGQKFPDAHLKAMKLTMAEGKYCVTVGEVLDKGTIKLEPTTKPGEMDITGTEGPNKEKTFPAIYELTGDTLRICYDLAGKKRPTEFKTVTDTRLFLVSYKREKN